MGKRIEIVPGPAVGDDVGESIAPRYCLHRGEKRCAVKVLVIEDSEDVVESTRTSIALRWPDAAVLSTRSGTAGVRLVEAEAPDAVILGLELADRDGMDVLADIRGVSNVPVLIVSVKADERSRVRGLECGADDYMVKPFSATELLARVAAVLRRVRMTEAVKDEPVITARGITLDLESGRAYVDGVERDFTATEWKLLSYLVRNAGKVISQQSLALNVWGMNHVESSTIKMCVRRLRRKLGEDTQSPRFIRSYRGRGYSFEGDRAAPQSAAPAEVDGLGMPAGLGARSRPDVPSRSFSNWSGGTGARKR